MSNDEKCPLCGCDLGSKGDNQHLFRCGTNVMGDVVSFIGTVCLTTQITQLRAEKERLQGIVDAALAAIDDAIADCDLYSEGEYRDGLTAAITYISDARQAAEAAPEDGDPPQGQGESDG